MRKLFCVRQDLIHCLLALNRNLLNAWVSEDIDEVKSPVWAERKLDPIQEAITVLRVVRASTSQALPLKYNY